MFLSTKRVFHKIITKVLRTNHQDKSCKKYVNLKKIGTFSFIGLGGIGMYEASNKTGRNEILAQITSYGRFLRSVYIGTSISIDYYISMLGLTEEAPNYEIQMNRIHQRAAEKILKGCLQNGGLYVKMGQGLVALNHILPKEYLNTLQVLHDKCLIRTENEVIEIFKQDFGKTPTDIFEEFDSNPVAAASLAQVFKAKTKEGLEVAVKVQYIDLQKRFHSDIATIQFLLKIVCFMHPTFNFTWILEDMKDTLKEELDFIHEGKNAERCAKDLSHLNFVYVPKVIWDTCSTRVLTLEYIHATKVNQLEELKRLGYSLADIDRKLFRIFGEQIFYTGFIHADPHPGNVLVRKDKNNKIQVVLLDHGLYNYLPNNHRLALCNFWNAIVLNDYKNMQKYSKKLGVVDFEIFAEILTQRPLKTGIVFHKKLTEEELKYMTKMAQDRFDGIIKTLRNMPRSMILVIRNLNTVRSIAKNHGDPVNRFTSLARIASSGVFDTKHSGVKSKIIGVKQRIQFEWKLWYGNLIIWLFKFILKCLQIVGRIPDITKVTSQIA